MCSVDNTFINLFFQYFCYYKGLSLISLLMGVVVLCGTLANLDVRWLSHSSQVRRKPNDGVSIHDVLYMHIPLYLMYILSALLLCSLHTNNRGK